MRKKNTTCYIKGKKKYPAMFPDKLQVTNCQSKSFYYFALIYHRGGEKEMMKTTCQKLKSSPQDVLKKEIITLVRSLKFVITKKDLDHLRTL